MWRFDDASGDVRIDDISVSSVPLVCKEGQREERAKNSGRIISGGTMASEATPTLLLEGKKSARYPVFSNGGHGKRQAS